MDDILKIINKVNKNLDNNKSVIVRTKKNYKKIDIASSKTICYYSETEIRKIYNNMKKINFYGVEV